ncbi:MAG: hypothetical protein JW959_00120 [Pirellulales bacterium]|nr:hypothetical protein [Pirellulales bacterium]
MEEHSTIAADASTEYVCRWNRLVSTTNWQKGEIIRQWREALQSSDAPPEEFSDEAWSRTVGGVSPQHVGRLRRVYERFGEVHDQYDGLYWSHFLAALDWPDAEMYLEGAVQSGWSVPQMKKQRRQATGAVGADATDDSGLVFSQPEADLSNDERQLPKTISETTVEVRDAGHAIDDAPGYLPPGPLPPSASPLRPFESLPPLPPDVDEAFELMKLAILAHKVGGWRDFAREDFLSVLDALRQLALAPAE